MKIVRFIAVSAALLGSTQAAVLVAYNFGTTFTLVPTTPNAAIVQGNITAAAGLSAQNSGITFVGSSGPRVLGWESAAAANVSSTLEAALTANQYFTFSITPVAGQQMSLSNITFFGNSGASTDIPQSFTLEISTDGTNYASVGTGALVNNSFTGYFDYSLASYVDITSQTTFRMAFYDAVTGGTPWNSGNWVRFDDITVNGTVSPVPEPVGLILGAAGIAFTALRRRRA